MGQKVKGGMYCPACNRPVMGMKNSHGLRNTAAFGASAVLGPGALLGSKVERYVCPNCGGRVQRLKSSGPTSTPAEKFQALLVIGYIVLVLLALGAPGWDKLVWLSLLAASTFAAWAIWKAIRADQASRRPPPEPD